MDCIKLVNILELVLFYISSFKHIKRVLLTFVGIFGFCFNLDKTIIRDRHAIRDVIKRTHCKMLSVVYWCQLDGNCLSGFKLSHSISRVICWFPWNDCLNSCDLHVAQSSEMYNQYSNMEEDFSLDGQLQMLLTPYASKKHI